MKCIFKKKKASRVDINSNNLEFYQTLVDKIWESNCSIQCKLQQTLKLRKEFMKSYKNDSVKLVRSEAIHPKIHPSCTKTSFLMNPIPE